MPTSQHLQAAYIEARTRLSKVTETLTPTDLLKKLGTAPNSIGFLLQHIAEVELLFCKNVFGHTEVKVVAHTVIDQKDTGVWTDLTAIQNLIHESGQTIASIMASVAEEDWSTQITTKEFGTKTKAEAFGRIISHTAYHAGQVAMIQKYGS
ncbi:DinB family protein [Aquirufa regiilacus]